MQDCISLKLEVQYCDYDENHANMLGAVNIVNHIIVKLRQGSGKERQGKARKGKERQGWRKVKGLKA